MSDQTTTSPAKPAADAVAAPVGTSPAAKADTVKAEPAKAEATKAQAAPAAKPAATAPVTPAPAKSAPAEKASVAIKPVEAPAAVNATSAKPAVAAQVAANPAKPAIKATQPKNKNAPKTTKMKSAVSTIVAAAKAAAPVKKETIMETTTATTQNYTAETKKAAEAMTDRVKGLMGDMSTRAKGAYEKGTEMVSQATEFSKGNVEALVESGKIAAKGAQEMGQTYAEDTKKGFEELTAALKEFTSVKSPTEFIELQSKLVRKSFDTAVAQTSKNSEMFLKLAGDVIQPISNRVSVAVDSFKKAA